MANCSRYILVCLFGYTTRMAGVKDLALLGIWPRPLTLTCSRRVVNTVNQYHSDFVYHAKKETLPVTILFGLVSGVCDVF